ncbi:MAG: pyrimidine 5'-nucleotidase [Beijerinckiaceae bacterium]
MEPGTNAERFAHIDTWVFDLDNTLYPPHCDLWPKIDMQITRFMCDMFGLDGMSCRALQKYYYLRYGTTMHGLIAEYGIAPQVYLDFVHDIDRSSIEPDAALAQAIAALPGRKLIFTNGSHAHAEKTTEALGLSGLFDGVCDIVATNYMPKPEAEAYRTFFARHDVNPATAVIFEDIVRNLAVPHAAGMTTVLVTPKQGAHDHREPWEISEDRPGHVHHVTDDLARFLRGIVPANRA